MKRSAKLSPGDAVVLNAYEGQITRMIVEDLGDVVTVCTWQELESAKRELREPRRIGFKKRDICVAARRLKGGRK